MCFSKAPGLISGRVPGLPAPAVAAHIGKRFLCLPAKDLLCLGGVCVDRGQIACAARADDVGDGNIVDLGEGVHHFQHADAAAGAEVEDLAAGVRLRIADRAQMALGQIDDVDIIAHAGTVRGVVVVAEDGQPFAAADGDLRDVGHQIVGNAVRVFSDQAGFVRADGVKVAEQHDGKRRIGPAGTLQDLLDHELRPAVGIGAAAGLRRLIQWRRLVAVDRGRGREDELMAVMLAHDLQNGQRGVQIVAVIEQRLFDGFADGLESGKVDDAGDVVVGKKPVHRGPVAAVCLDEGRALAGDALDAVNDLRRTVVQIINNDDILSRVQQGNGGVAADEPGAASQKNGHMKPSCIRNFSGSIARGGKKCKAKAQIPCRNRQYDKL